MEVVILRDSQLSEWLNLYMLSLTHTPSPLTHTPSPLTHTHPHTLPPHTHTPSHPPPSHTHPLTPSDALNPSPALLCPVSGVGSAQPVQRAVTSIGTGEYRPHPPHPIHELVNAFPQVRKWTSASPTLATVTSSHRAMPVCSMTRYIPVHVVWRYHILRVCITVCTCTCISIV